jgi:hypothetical protein
MSLFGLNPLDNPLLHSLPAIASASLALMDAGLGLYSQTCDSINSGGAIGSKYLQAYSLYITDEEALLSALESLAASPSGAASWVTTEISDLKASTQSGIKQLYSQGGAIGSLSLGSALSSIPGAGSNPGLAGDPLLQSIASIFPALASALANPSAFAALFSGGVNMSAGPGITQSGYLNDASGANIGQGGIGNSAFGNAIGQAGDLNSGQGSWLDALGTNNTQSGTHDLAVGNYNYEYGSSDVTNGNRNTLSGSNDVALGDNNTIIGDSARVFGSGLSASTGQTVFGTASNFTVINADGTWSTVVNGSTTVGSCASTNSSLMAAESAAIASAQGTAQTNYTGLSSQLSALGWSQVVSSIGADVASGAFGGWNFAPSAAAASSGFAASSALSWLDAAAVANIYHFGSYGNVDLATLSALVGMDGSSTIIGADAAAALAAYSAGANPFPALGQLFTDARNTNITSSATTLSGVNAQDRANTMLAGVEYAAGNLSALASTLSTLAASSNKALAEEAAFAITFGGGTMTSASLAVMYKTTGIPVPFSVTS